MRQPCRRLYSSTRDHPSLIEEEMIIQMNFNTSILPFQDWSLYFPHQPRNSSQLGGKRIRVEPGDIAYEHICHGWPDIGQDFRSLEYYIENSQYTQAGAIEDLNFRRSLPSAHRESKICCSLRADGFPWKISNIVITLYKISMQALSVRRAELKP